MYLLYNDYAPEDCIGVWHVTTPDWLTVNYSHEVWTNDWNPPTWTGFNVGVNSNPDSARNGSYEIEYWYYDFMAMQWYYQDYDSVHVYQLSGAPSILSCDPNPIEISPSGPDVEVAFDVDIDDIYVELKYRYEEGSELTAGPYYADAYGDGGRWILVYTPAHLAAAGTYRYTQIRNYNGGSWHGINYTIVLQEAGGGRTAAIVSSVR